jgi:hypothetical protein
VVLGTASFVTDVTMCAGDPPAVPAATLKSNETLPDDSDIAAPPVGVTPWASLSQPVRLDAVRLVGAELADEPDLT